MRNLLMLLFLMSWSCVVAQSEAGKKILDDKFGFKDFRFNTHLYDVDGVVMSTERNSDDNSIYLYKEKNPSEIRVFNTDMKYCTLLFDVHDLLASIALRKHYVVTEKEGIDVDKLSADFLHIANSFHEALGEPISVKFEGEEDIDMSSSWKSDSVYLKIRFYSDSSKYKIREKDNALIVVFTLEVLFIRSGESRSKLESGF